MLHNPLQYTCVRQTSYDNKQHADDDHRRRTEAREGLFGIQHACDVQDAYSSEEHQVGAQLGKH